MNNVVVNACDYRQSEVCGLIHFHWRGSVIQMVFVDVHAPEILPRVRCNIFEDSLMEIGAYPTFESN